MLISTKKIGNRTEAGSHAAKESPLYIGIYNTPLRWSKLEYACACLLGDRKLIKEMA